MKLNLSKNLKKMAELLGGDLYIVGGYVRNALMSSTNTNLLNADDINTDIDICGSKTPDEVAELLGEEYNVMTEFASFGSVLIRKDDELFEYTTWRSDSYMNSSHRPSSVAFTMSIEEDARRRDFTCNAIYYKVDTDEIIDILGGVQAVKDRIMIVCDENKTLQEDGLRLLRLVRQSGELGYKIHPTTARLACENSHKLKDIKAERITSELKKILVCDTKNELARASNVDNVLYFDDFDYTNGMKKVYNALENMRIFGLWQYIIPEIMDCYGMVQNAKYHKCDVYYHTLHSVISAPPKLRLTMLLHDIGKPKSMKENGNFYFHPKIGGEMVRDIMGQNRLKFSNKEIDTTARLVDFHAIDINGDMKESKIRLFMLMNYDIMMLLFGVKFADNLGMKTDNATNFTVRKWIAIWDSMIAENVPFSVKDLDIKGNEVIDIIGKEYNFLTSTYLKELQKLVALKQIENIHEALLKAVIKVHERMMKTL